MVKMARVAQTDDLAQFESIHPERRGGKVITQPHSLQSPVAKGFVVDKRVRARQVPSDIRTESVKIACLVVTEGMRAERIELLPRALSMLVRPICVYAAKVKHGIRPEASRKICAPE